LGDNDHSSRLWPLAGDLELCQEHAPESLAGGGNLLPGIIAIVRAGHASTIAGDLARCVDFDRARFFNAVAIIRFTVHAFARQ